MRLDAYPLLRRAIHFLKWTICIAVVVFGVKYCFESKARVHAGEPPHRWSIQVPDILNGAYTAKYTFINRDTILLRLYRTGDPTLLAERTYTEHGVDLHWSDHELIYDTSEDFYLGGSIQLPPTRVDRLLAKLP